MAFKGKSTIELRNAETGELEFKTEDENMVTNAAHNIINHEFDGFFGNNLRYDKPYLALTPLYKQCFGGLLLFDKNITENIENIIISNNINQVGHAANPYIGANPERGSLNAVESKEINDRKGYRFVWDFGTDKANGTIRSVALTSFGGGITGQYGQSQYSENSGDAREPFYGVFIESNGAKYGLVNQNSQIGGISTTSQLTSYDLGRVYPIGFFKNINILLGASYDLAPYYLTNSIIFKEIEFSRKDFGLFDTDNSIKIETEKTVTSTKKFCAPFELHTDGEKIYSLAVTGDNTFDFIVINSETLEIEFEESYTVQDASFIQYTTGVSTGANNHSAVYFDGYFYIKSASQYSEPAAGYRLYDKYYRINKNDLSDYSIIEFDFSSDFSSGFQMFIYMYSFNGLLCVRSSTARSSYRILMRNGKVLKNKYIAYRQVENRYCKKPMLFYASYIPITNRPVSTLYYAVYGPFLSTINNLSTPVVKNETQTMKVTYEITEI